jgi:hypothetical protein
MFAYLPWAHEGNRIAINPTLRRAEAYRNGIGLAFTYDVHRGCAPADHRAAERDVLSLLRSFR